jgi:hypothetical protein
MGPEDYKEVEAADILMRLNKDDGKLRLEREECEKREHQQIWAANPIPKRRRTDAKPCLGYDRREPMRFSQAWPRDCEPLTVKYVDYDPDATEDDEGSKRSVHPETGMRDVALR